MVCMTDDPKLTLTYFGVLCFYMGTPVQSHLMEETYSK